MSSKRTYAGSGRRDVKVLIAKILTEAGYHHNFKNTKIQGKRQQQFDELSKKQQ